MRWIFFALVLVHGLIHLMGFAKAFGLATLDALTQPISRAMGVIWLIAGLAMLGVAVLFALKSPSWPIAGLAAVVMSQVVIGRSWKDAKVGTIGNVLVLAGCVYGLVR